MRRKHSRRKSDDSKIQHVWRFIFQPDVTQLLAWGTIRIRSGGGWSLFTDIVRKMSTEHMRRAYRGRALGDEDGEKDIYGRTIFLKLVSMITRGERNGGHLSTTC